MPVNEGADRLAKEGPVGVPSSYTTVIPFRKGIKLIKRHLELELKAG
jgi:hypothetical protein